MRKRLFVLATLTAIASGCVHEDFLDTAGQTDLIPIGIHGSINQQQTRATAEGFVGGDAVGLYAVNYTEENTVAGTLVADGNQADNVKYVFDEGAHKWTPVRSVYYKDINTHADLYLYYPYQASISNVNDANFEVRKDQSAAKTATSLSGYEASDFLWGKATDITPSQSAVSIQLSHRLSAVQVTLAQGTGFADGEFEGLDKNIILTNTTRKASLDYATGTATPVGDPQADGIVMCPQGDGSFRAVVIPQSVEAGIKLLAITIDGIAYSFKQNEMVKYMTGRQLNFTITINKKSATGQYELVLTDTQIVDWTEDLNTHGGEARQYFVVNVTEPGTLQAQIESMGKNPAKIKNLKVVGIVNSNDIFFMRDEMTILEAINMKESEMDNRCLPDLAFNDKQSLCYFVFPEHVNNIGNYSFRNTSLSGTLIIPEDVKSIGDWAFAYSAISSIVFNNKTNTIGSCAFYDCSSLTGKLILPEYIETIGGSCFDGCDFSGDLLLPDKLTHIGESAFARSGKFSSGLVLPDKVTELPHYAFYDTEFKGRLDLNNCVKFDGNSHFYGSGFSGELIIPEGTVALPENFIRSCNFSKISFPSSLRTIGKKAVEGNTLVEKIDIKDGLISIGESAFEYCSQLLSLDLPSSLQTIQSYAFSCCFYISSITCLSNEPPTVQNNSFNGVAKDNFALEVPEQSIIRYQTEVGWSDFKRITAHYDFSIGCTRMRALNAQMQRTYTLRCPAGNGWCVSDKPEWISVEPSSGIGKTDITITIYEMPRTNEEFEVNVGSFQYPEYHNYKGRNGSVTFTLSGKDYTCKLDVEQYDYDKADGEVVTLQNHSVGNGIDIVFIGEGYDAKDIADGKFETDCANGYKHFFNIEPYKTYKDFFNVYSVMSQSDESGIETASTIIANKFMKNGVRDVEAAFKWAKKVDNTLDLSKVVVILLDNNNNYYGNTYMYNDGSALSIVPISEEDYPYDFRGIIQHEAGGHAFGKLGEEYIWHNTYITTCGCMCNCDHPKGENDMSSLYGQNKSLGWFKNLSMHSDHNMVPWAHLMFHPKYSDRVDMYEGAYMHMRGMYRSEITSCMNNNIPYFNSISRQAIVERIKEYAGETFDFEDFVAKDKFDVGTRASVNNFDWTFGVDPKWNRGPEHGSIIYMGEHPNVK